MDENRDASDSESGSAPPTRFEEEEVELAITTDPKKRRQIQNRIAQRVYRQKQKKRLEKLEHKASFYKPEPLSLREDSPPHLTDEQTARYASWTPLAMAYPFANAITQRAACSPALPEASPGSNLIAGALALGLHHATAPVATSLAITSTPLRLAVLTNLQILGISASQYALDRAVSPFYNSDSTHLAQVGHHTPDLAPTRLQCEITHHPYIDVLPFRGLRDNLLVALDCSALDEPELCADIARHLSVWGRLPQLAMSYEWAPEFVEKWAWVLDDESRSVSNFWRAQRGEEPFEA